MTFDELQAEVLKLDPKARARLAERLLESLEALSDREIAQQWADEAERRDADLAAHPEAGRPASEVLRGARARLK
jgi:plasmid stabilization system protein ParE